MSDTARVVVVGGGAMGAATAWWLARSGYPVLLLEQFDVGHDRGSSHGSSRIFRFSYDDPRYTRLGLDARDLWAALERESGATLLDLVGCLDHGPADAVGPVHGALRAQGIDVDRIDPNEAANRWPGFVFDEYVLLQPGAGRVDASRAVAALHAEAVRLGAEVRTGVRVRAVSEQSRGVVVETDGEEIQADVVVVAVGAWLPHLEQPVTAALPPLRVTQEQPAYFVPRDDVGGSVESWPSFVHRREAALGGAAFAHYGLGTPGRGVKVGAHGTGPEVHPDRPVAADPAVTRQVEAYVERWLPGLRPHASAVDRCLYTSTPDEEFFVERHGGVVVCSPCSGHGFKFVPAIGRRTAELALGTRGSFWG